MKNFYRKTKDESVICAVEVGVSLCAGWMNRNKFEVNHKINQTLAFVAEKDCYITEPFILEALAKNIGSVKPEEDVVFKVS